MGGVDPHAVPRQPLAHCRVAGGRTAYVSRRQRPRTAVDRSGEEIQHLGRVGQPLRAGRRTTLGIDEAKVESVGDLVIRDALEDKRLGFDSPRFAIGQDDGRPGRLDREHAGDQPLGHGPARMQHPRAGATLRPELSRETQHERRLRCGQVLHRLGLEERDGHEDRNGGRFPQGVMRRADLQVEGPVVRDRQAHILDRTPLRDRPALFAMEGRRCFPTIQLSLHQTTLHRRRRGRRVGHGAQRLGHRHAGALLLIGDKSPQRPGVDRCVTGRPPHLGGHLRGIPAHVIREHKAPVSQIGDEERAAALHQIAKEAVDGVKGPQLRREQRAPEFSRQFLAPGVAKTPRGHLRPGGGRLARLGQGPGRSSGGCHVAGNQ